MAMFFTALLGLLACALLPEMTLQAKECTCDGFVDCSGLSLSTFDTSKLSCSNYATFYLIDLSRNFLRSFPNDVHIFENVNISNNHLKTLEAKIDQRMEVLDVSFNSITKINFGDKFFSLQKLYAAGNMFISSDYIKGFCNLNYVDVTDSMLESLDPFTRCSGLIVLIASHNDLSVIPDQIGILKRLVRLNLSYNKLTEVSRLPRSLEFLDLSHNEIMSITLSSFEGLNVVKNIDLKFNKISSIWENSFIGLKKLYYLDLSHNLLQVLSDKVFAGLTEIETILLSDNRLENVSRGAFVSLHALEELQMGNNLLTEIPALLLEQNVNKVNFSLNDIRTVDYQVVVNMLTDSVKIRKLVLVANPIRGDDLGVQNLIFSFAAACSETLENSTRNLIEEWRTHYDFGETKNYRDFGRLAYSSCPCAGIFIDNAVLQICVSEAATGWSGRHWLNMQSDDKSDESDGEFYNDEL